MELTLTALINAMIYWLKGSSSGDKQLEFQQKSSKFKMHQLPFPLDVTIECTLVVYSNLTGSQSFYIRTISFFRLNVFICIWYFMVPKSKF